jgi:hypothetical protein
MDVILVRNTGVKQEHTTKTLNRARWMNTVDRRKSNITDWHIFESHHHCSFLSLIPEPKLCICVVLNYLSVAWIWARTFSTVLTTTASFLLSWKRKKSKLRSSRLRDTKLHQTRSSISFLLQFCNVMPRKGLSLNSL